MVLNILVFVLASLAVVPRAGANELPFQVIVDPENPIRSIERELLSNMYFKRVTVWPDGASVYPVDLDSGSTVRRRFSEEVLRRQVQAVRTYWQQRIFTGRGVPPPELNNDEEVIDYVRTHRGAVGYISNTAAPRNVRVIPVK